MTTVNITIMGLNETSIRTARVEGRKNNIAELYRTDNEQFLLLWRKVKDDREQWERKVYKDSKRAEKALYERTEEYMQHFFNADEYVIAYKISL